MRRRMSCEEGGDDTLRRSSSFDDVYFLSISNVLYLRYGGSKMVS
jgi:hypothetical protein